MKRRDLLKLLAVGFALNSTATTRSKAASSTADNIKPNVLKPGDTVGVIAPGTAVSNPDDLLRVREAIEYFGLKLKLGRNVVKGSGYRSRSIAERIDDLHSMFDDDSVAAVFAIRGGYGSARLLDKIDYNLIRKKPKIFLGYSDITALHLAIRKKTGLVTFHGPMLLSPFSDFTIEYFKKALFERQPIGEIKNPDRRAGFRNQLPTRSIVPGYSSGRLAGGNLSLICSLLGTPFEIDSTGSILMLEDVGEEPYRIDRMLTQLRLAGKLEASSGICFGICSECDPKSGQATTWDLSLGEVLDSLLSDLKIPTFSGLAFGHTSDQVTLPLGVEAQLDSVKCSIIITESATI